MLGVVLLFSGIVLLAAAAGLTTALLRPDSALDAAITMGVVTAAGTVAAMLAAGAVGLLRPGVVLILEAAWALAAAALLRRRDPTCPRRRRPAPRRPGRNEIRSPPWVALAGAPAAVALAWPLLVALVLPPFAFGAFTSPLTMAASWVRDANIAPAPLSLCCAR